MDVLLTGAFGNIGRSTLDALLARGHRVRAFDLPTPANRRAANGYTKSVDIFWGDLRQLEDLRRAVRGVQSVLHLGFVIPRLSATGVNSEERPDWARAVNVGGTCNLIQALEEETLRAQAVRHSPAPRLVFASSLHVYGKTQHLPPPRTIAETPVPVEHYARHKVEAERMVRESRLEWAILRLGAALPLRLIMDSGMFDVPLENRIEFVHTRDAGEAFACAANHPGVPGRTLLIGGGAGCQLYYRQMMAQVLDAVGVGALPDWAFAQEPYATDWLDTQESQSILHFQRRTFSDYTKDLKNRMGLLRGAVVMMRPMVRKWLLARSPYKEGLPRRHEVEKDNP